MCFEFNANRRCRLQKHVKEKKSAKNEEDIAEV